MTVPTLPVVVTAMQIKANYRHWFLLIRLVKLSGLLLSLFEERETQSEPMGLGSAV